jgi:hypothetical protein
MAGYHTGAKRIPATAPATRVSKLFAANEVYLKASALREFGRGQHLGQFKPQLACRVHDD